jgi:hypothetical protein
MLRNLIRTFALAFAVLIATCPAAAAYGGPWTADQPSRAVAYLPQGPIALPGFAATPA